MMWEFLGWVVAVAVAVLIAAVVTGVAVVIVGAAVSSVREKRDKSSHVFSGKGRS